MKRIISIIAAAALLFALVPALLSQEIDAKNETYTVSFVFGEAYNERAFRKNETPQPSICFDEGPFDGEYLLFNGFDKEISPVKSDECYTAQTTPAKPEDVVFFSLSSVTSPENADVYLSLYAGCGFDKLDLRLLYNDEHLTFSGIASAIQGLTYKDGVLSYAGEARSGKKIAVLHFKTSKDFGAQTLVDLLPDVYKDGRRLPVAVNAGAVIRAEVIAGDLDGSGRVDEKDANALLSTLSAGKDGADLNGDGVCSVRDLNALLCSAAGMPVRLCDPSFDGKHEVSYSASLGGKLNGDKTQKLAFRSAGGTVTAQPIDEFYRFSGWSDGWPTRARSDAYLCGDADFEAKFVLQAPEFFLPKIDVRTKNGHPIDSKDEYIEATFTMTDMAEGGDLIDLPAQIHGRGNYFWSVYRDTKPSYKLKLDKKKALIPGKGRERDWVLQTTYTDKSMLRNWATLHLGSFFDNIPFVAGCIFVDVTVNGDYLGVYLLCEQIEVSPARIDLDDSVTGPDKDLLFTLDGRAEPPRVSIPDGQEAYEIKSTVADSDLRQIAKDLIKADKALKTGEKSKIKKYFDIPSFVDMFILEELSNDRDVGFASTYYMRRDGIIYMTAPWDFDLAWGNDYEYPNYNVLMTDVNGNFWFKELWAQDWFKELVSERTKELWGYVEAVRQELAVMGELLSNAAERTYRRFDVMGRPIFLETPELGALQTYGEHVVWFMDWYKKRMDFLYSTFCQ